MRIVIPGGSGQVGTILARYLATAGHEVVVLSRSPASPATRDRPWRVASWDGRTPGEWTREIDGSDALIHLSGRTVNCRYTPKHRKEILESRIETTRAVGEAIAHCAQPPRTWLNASTSTIYRHNPDRGMDEATGEILVHQAGVPETYNFSVGVALAWEKAFQEAPTPATRKVALRTSIVMSPDTGGAFDMLIKLVRRGLSGKQGDGLQFVSWMHELDYARAVRFLLEHEEISGPVNLTSPEPLPNHEFMAALRQANGSTFNLPANRWMLAVGAALLRTETELVLKSRRVVPGVLTAAGFEFIFPGWPRAALSLARRWRLLHD